MREARVPRTRGEACTHGARFPSLAEQIAAAGRDLGRSIHVFKMVKSSFCEI